MSENVPSPQRGRGTRPLLTEQTLPCGADVDELLEQVADGHADQPTDHQKTCAHCQAAIGEFTDLWDPVRQSAATAVPAPDEIRAAVMRLVRVLVQNVWYTLQLGDRGSTRVAARVVATIARDAARRVPGVRVALGRSTHPRIAAAVEKATRGHRHPDAAVGVLGRTAVIDLAIAVSYDDPVHQVAHQVQADVIAALRNGVDLKTVTVNVTVDDVLEPPSPAL